MGLTEGPVRQEPRQLVRKTPRLSFDEVKLEVKTRGQLASLYLSGSGKTGNS